MVKAYEEDLHDASEFDSWQKKMRGLDEEMRQNEIERRRVEMAMAAEEAKAAVAMKLQENQLVVLKQK